MITEAESTAIHAEVLALQAVILSVFKRLARDRPELTPLFCAAFDEAETILSGVAVQMAHAPANSTIGALRVVEEFRKAVIRDESQCGSGDRRAGE